MYIIFLMLWTSIVKLMFLHPHWEGCITITWIIWENILLCPVLTWTAYLHPLWVNFMVGPASMTVWIWGEHENHPQEKVFPLYVELSFDFLLLLLQCLWILEQSSSGIGHTLERLWCWLKSNYHRSDLSRVLQLIDFSTSLPNLAGFW